MRKFFILILMIVAAQQASAQTFRGRWLCSDCEISGATGVAIGAASDMVAFIRSTVNAQVFAQVPGVTAPRTGWRPNDTITICDGTTCMMLLYNAAGVFIPTLAPFRDTGVGYRNANLSLMKGKLGNVYAVFYMTYTYTDWTTSVTPYQRTGSVTVGPLTPVQVLADGSSIGGVTSFTTGYSWGGATSSSAAAAAVGGGGGGGGCGGSCDLRFSVEEE